GDRPAGGAGAGEPGVAGGAAVVRPPGGASAERDHRRPGPADPAAARTTARRPGGQSRMSSAPTTTDADPGTAPAVSSYQVMGLAAVVVMGVAMLQYGAGRWAVIPTLV